MEQITGKDLVGLSPMSGVGVMSLVYKEREQERLFEERRLEKLKQERLVVKETFPQAYERITKVVCGYFGLPVENIANRSRKRLVVKCRQISCFFLKGHKQHFSLKLIGQPFFQDHTTVIHSCQTVQDLIDTDLEYRADIEKITDLLNTLQ